MALYRRSRSAGASARGLSATDMKTILQIEDNFANKRLVERVLEAHGYRLLHAADGRSGIDLALQEHPDLILLDMGLPDICLLYTSSASAVERHFSPSSTSMIAMPSRTGYFRPESSQTSQQSRTSRSRPGSGPWSVERTATGHRRMSSKNGGKDCLLYTSRCV